MNLTATFRKFSNAPKNVSKGKGSPIPVWTGPEGFTRFRLPEFLQNRNIKVGSLSDLHTGLLYPPGETTGTHFCYRLSRPQDHSAAGRITSMKSTNERIGDQTSNLPSPIQALTIPTSLNCDARDENLCSMRYGQ